jgi:exopolyphosphatase/guanosine-5'-triphosphate,3'-diphosphate pyrophosphatase
VAVNRTRQAAPLTLAAIDAGSNAIRLVIVRTDRRGRLRRLVRERVPVRLGRNVFTDGRFSPETINRAVATFQHFRDRMDHFGVSHYRAVATSATREARNRARLLRRIRREADIRLEVIDGAEEARLVRSAVLGALGRRYVPRLICDLGGGSLELSLMKQRAVEKSVVLPVGTVRLLETFRIEDEMDEDEVEEVRNYVRTMLESFLPQRPKLNGALAVACGGNAEALARIAPGARVAGMPSISLRLLKDRMWQILSLDVRRRMKLFDVRRDRAEVMGIAALVFNTLGRWLKLDALVVPGVGVREGLLDDLVHTARRSRCAA